MQLDSIIVKYCTGILINWEGVVNPDLSQLKIGMGPQLVIRKELKRDEAEHFENVLNWDRVAGKDIEANEKVCDTLDVKEDLFCEEELATVLKGLKNNKAPGTDSVVNEFLKYGGSEVRK